MKLHNYRNNIRLHYLFAAFCLLFANLLQAATITVQADRNPVVLNEQFTLTFSADSNPAGTPDFSPLNKNFDIVRQGKSSSVRIINGDVSQNISWNLVLYPKQAGQIEIPAIHFGSDQSQAVTLNVSATPTTPQAQGQGGQTQQDIIVEAEVEPKTAYVQQQIVYIQRLYFARDFFDNSTLSTPQVKAGKVDLEKLGNGREYTEMKNGRQYKVIERRYALFPIQSGKLEIAPTFFEGRLIENGGQQQSFGFFSRPSGRVIRRYSAPVSIDVKPQATAYKGKHWLPAKNLTLHANWSTPPEQAKTGEPITLTIGMIANGLRAEQLPELQINMPAGLKTYNDQPVLHNESNSDEMIGTRQEKIVVIATQAGEFTIPEVTLSWWDTKTETQQIAKIPEKKLVATGASAATTQAPVAPVPMKSAVEKPQQPDTIKKKAVVTTVDHAAADKSASVWFYLSLLLLSILAFVLYLLWKQQGGNTSSAKPQKVIKTKRSVGDILKTIELSCNKNDVKGLRNALIEWGQAYLQLPHSNLQNIANSVKNETLKKEIHQLMKVLYAPDESDWSCVQLCQQVQAYRVPKVRKKEASRIASLYPE